MAIPPVSRRPVFRDSPLAERFSWLARDGYRVAYLYERPDSSTFRYRAYNMVEALNGGSEHVSAAWFFAHEWEALAERIALFDALVICRCKYSYGLDALSSRARAHQVEVIYDVDDLVVDTDLVPLVAHTLAQTSDETWDYWYAYVGRLQAAMRMCDRAIVTTPSLAAHIHARTGMDVRVVRNFLNRDQLAVSGPVYDAKAMSGYPVGDVLRVGYFSGTPSHTHDFQIVSDALVRVLQREPRVRVRTVGYIAFKDPLARHLDRVDHHPLTDLVSLQELIGATHINLVPLQSNAFTDSKSELKFFEAGIVGTVSVASPTATMRDVVNDGHDGLLANAQEWEEKMMVLIDDLLQTRERYAEMASAAQQHAVDRYSWDRLVPAIEAALQRQ